MSILIGWWIIPTLITICGFFYASHWADKQPKGGYFGNAIEVAVAGVAWLLGSMFSWIVYLAAMLLLK